MRGFQQCGYGQHVDAPYCAIRPLYTVEALCAKVSLTSCGWKQPGFSHFQTAFSCALTIAVFYEPHITPVNRRGEFDDPILAVYLGQYFGPRAAG